MTKASRLFASFTFIALASGCADESASARAVATTSPDGCAGGTAAGGGGASGSGASGGGGSGAGASGGGGEGGSFPEPQVLLSDLELPDDVFLFGDDVLWVEDEPSGGSTVFRCSKAGCPGGPASVVTSQDWIFSPDIEGTALYWSVWSEGNTESCPLDAPCVAPTTVVDVVDPQWDIDVDGDSLYFVAGEPDVHLIGKCALAQCDLSSLVVLATGQSRAWDIFVADGYVYWTSLGTPPAFDDGKLLRCSTNGCGDAPTIIADNRTDLNAFTVRGSRVYWAEFGDFLDTEATDTIFSCPVDGCVGGVPDLFATEVFGIDSLTADESRVYWTERGRPPFYLEGRVRSCPLDGCAAAPKVHAVQQQGASGIVVDDTNLYWTTSLGGDLMTAPK
jgi:hypothetical protein